MNARFFTAVGVLLGLIAVYVVLPLAFGPKDTGEFSAYQEDRQDGSGWAGLAVAREIVENEGYDVRNVGSSPHILKDTDPKGTAYIAAGISVPYSPGEAKALKDFMVEGGTFLLLDDQGYGQDISREYGIQYTTRPILDAQFKKNQSFVQVNSIVDGQGFKLLFNAPSALQDVDFANSTIQPLIITGNTSYLDLASDGQIDVYDKLGPFNMGLTKAVGNDGGRIIVISDSGWLTNQMVQEDDNRKFLLYLLKKYLTEDGTVGEGRQLVLFDESRRTAVGAEVGIYTTERTLLNLLRSLPATGVILSLGLVVLGVVYLLRLPGRESWVHRFLPKTYVPPPIARESKDLFVEIMRLKAHLDASGIGETDPVLQSALKDPAAVAPSEYPQLLKRLARTMELDVPALETDAAAVAATEKPVAPPPPLSTPTKA